MKLKNIFLALTAASFALASCSTMDQPAQSEYDDQVVFTTPALAQHAVNAIYDAYTIMASYRTDWMMYYGANTDVEVWINSTSNTSDRNLVCKYVVRPNDSTLDKNNYQYIYGGNMQCIERANVVIAGFEKHADLEHSQPLRDLYGEALTVRAMLYLDLIHYYGEVPARFTPNTNETTYLPNVNRDIIYKQLLSDLKKAADVMSYKSVINAVHASKACAQGIYARIALEAAGSSLRCDDDKWNTGDPGHIGYTNDPVLKDGKGTYATALAGLEEAIKDSGFKLEENFVDIWKFLANRRYEAGHEFVFQLPFSDSRGQFFYHNYTPDLKRWPDGKTTRKALNPVLYFKYDPDDIRRDITCSPFQYENNQAVISGVKVSKMYMGKYRLKYAEDKVVFTGSDDGIKAPYLRLGDMYLMAAEIANELGQLEKAKSYLKPILDRAYKNTPEKVTSILSGLSDHDSFLSCIQDQRMFELAGEMLRKQDLIRWGILKAKLDEAKADMESLKNRKNQYSGWSNDLYYRPKPGDPTEFEIWPLSSTENPTVTDKSGGWKKQSSYLSGLDSNLYNYLYQTGINPEQNMWRPIPSTIITSYRGVMKNDFGY